MDRELMTTKAVVVVGRNYFPYYDLCFDFSLIALLRSEVTSSVETRNEFLELIRVMNINDA